MEPLNTAIEDSSIHRIQLTVLILFLIWTFILSVLNYLISIPGSSIHETRFNSQVSTEKITYFFMIEFCLSTVLAR